VAALTITCCISDVQKSPDACTFPAVVVTLFIACFLSQEIQRLSVQLKELEVELENVRCQPDHEKDQEIHRLRLALEERQQAEATRTVLCTSLVEEADQLRSQLGATVKVCQGLLARLDTDKNGGGEVKEMAQHQKAMEVCSASGAVYLFELKASQTASLFLLLRRILL